MNYSAYRISKQARSLAAQQYCKLNLMFIAPRIIVISEEQKPTGCHLIFYCTSYRLNMFRVLLCPALDYNILALELFF